MQGFWVQTGQIHEGKEEKTAKTDSTALYGQACKFSNAEAESLYIPSAGNARSEKAGMGKDRVCQARSLRRGLVAARSQNLRECFRVASHPLGNS